jgi:hypothetical protein
VLGDLIRSRAVDVVELDHIIRQGERSQIVANAHRIQRGELPVASRDEGGDFFLAERGRPESFDRSASRRRGARPHRRLEGPSARKVRRRARTPRHRAQREVPVSSADAPASRRKNRFFRLHHGGTRKNPILPLIQRE